MKTLFILFKSRGKILMFILVIVMAVIGCVKDQEDSTIMEQVDKSLYPFLFNKGSYWVYSMLPLKADTLKTIPKDSLTPPKDSIVYAMVHDTVTVESIEKDTLYITGNVRYYEYYRIKYHSSLQNQQYEDHLIGYVISRGMNNGGFMLLSSKRKGDKNRNTEIIDVMEEMKMEDRTYKKVVKMKVLKDEYINDSYFLYYADNVGIIRKEKLVNDTIRETWNLKHYKVNLLKPE